MSGPWAEGPGPFPPPGRIPGLVVELQPGAERPRLHYVDRVEVRDRDFASEPGGPADEKCPRCGRPYPRHLWRVLDLDVVDDEREMLCMIEPGGVV